MRRAARSQVRRFAIVGIVSAAMLMVAPLSALAGGAWRVVSSPNVTGAPADALMA
jgi:hypothetical protein